MPTSKRDKRVDLTKVRKKPKCKIQYVEKVRSLIDEFKRVYIVKLHNPRNQKVSELRKGVPNIKLVFGKNKVTELALGKYASDGHKSKLEKVCKYIKGQCALLFTDMSPVELREELDAYRCQEFSRSGAIAEQTVDIAKGPLFKFPGSMLQSLRDLKLPVKLVKGIVHMEEQYQVCKLGDLLTPQQCRILKLFQIEMSEFRVGLVATWSEEEGVEELEEKDSYLMRTSLSPHVLVVCKQLDDGQFYFIPEPFISNKVDLMETDDF